MEQHRGARAAAPRNPEDEDVLYRRAHDAAVLAAAKPKAVAAARALARSLLDPNATAADIERMAKEALDAIGLLWEAAAHVVRG